MKLRLGGSLLALLVFLFPVAGSATCGISAVCGDVGASLGGQVITEGVRVSWSTDDESGVASYVVYRVTNGGRAWLVTLSPQGSCGNPQGYLHTDTSPGSVIRYEVEVWAPQTFSPACVHEVVPE